MFFGFLNRLATDTAEGVNSVATVAQRRCTCMVRLAIQRYRIATLPDNRADDPDRLTIAFKHAPLLDM